MKHSFSLSAEWVRRAGTGYLLTSAYAGTRAGLSSTAYLASTAAGSGLDTFDPSVTLVASTQYWFYDDSALFPVIDFRLTGTAEPASANSPGGNRHYAV
jgi:hypothetical protein